jgi:hypothetical protein
MRAVSRGPEFMENFNDHSSPRLIEPEAIGAESYLHSAYHTPPGQRTGHEHALGNKSVTVFCHCFVRPRLSDRNTAQKDPTKTPMAVYKIAFAAIAKNITKSTSGPVPVPIKKTCEGHK